MNESINQKKAKVLEEQRKTSGKLETMNLNESQKTFIRMTIEDTKHIKYSEHIDLHLSLLE